MKAILKHNMLYLPALYSGFVQSSPNPPLFGSHAAAPGSSLLLGAPTARSVLWSRPLQAHELAHWL